MPHFMHMCIPAVGLTADSYNTAMTKRVGRSPPFPPTQSIRDWTNDLYLTVALLTTITTTMRPPPSPMTTPGTSSSYILFTSFLLLYMSTTTSTNTTVTGTQNDGRGLETQMCLEPQVCFFKFITFVLILL